MNDTLTQLFTHSTEYSPLESNSSGASQEIPSFKIQSKYTNY